ncbi:MAG: DAK2 domain-containing protein [Mycoplasma sp.]
MKKITTSQFKQMLISGANGIANEYRYINELNVFPVPDGDTGTNMKITVTNAAVEIEEFVSADFSLLGRAFSRSLLMNARGNSGVIFSQIMKGFFLSFKENQNELTVEELARCFDDAKKIAYQAVSNPVEGTILTVIRVVSERIWAELESLKNIEEFFKFVIEEAKIALDDTPNLLEELKRVGVVDSGGYGLWCFLKGMYLSIIGKGITANDAKNNAEPSSFTLDIDFDEHDNEEGFGYCSEIIMKIGAKVDPNEKEKKAFNIEKFKSELLVFGNSLVCVQDEDIVKVHVHTFQPGKFLTVAQKYGEFLKLKFENMTEQYYARIQKEGVEIIDTKKPKPKSIKLRDEISIVMTVPSANIKTIYKEDYGIEYTLNTSDIGNPSIQDIIMLVQNTKSNKVFVITDDSNIVLAANQASEIVKDTVDVRVIKGTNAFEALIAALEFNPLVSMDMNEKQMRSAVSCCNSAVISKAIKDVQYSHISIKKEDFISIMNKKIEFANSERLAVVKKTIDLLMRKASSPDILILIYGSKEDEAILEDIEQYAATEHGLICDFKNGGQKIYNYIIGLQ